MTQVHWYLNVRKTYEHLDLDSMQLVCTLVFKLSIVAFIFIDKHFNMKSVSVLLDWFGNRSWWRQHCISKQTATSRCVLWDGCSCLYCPSKMSHDLRNPFCLKSQYISVHLSASKCMHDNNGVLNSDYWRSKCLVLNEYLVASHLISHTYN